MNFTQQISQIHQNIDDELSKRVFEWLLLYRLTGDNNYVRSMVSFFYSDFKAFAEEYNDRIIIYGAGNMGLACSLYFNRIIAFCDSNADKQDGLYLGYPVISPEILKTKYKSPNLGVIVEYGGFI